MLNPILRDLKKALIDARGDMVRAIATHRSPEKIQKLRGRTDVAWERLERALRETRAVTV